MNAKRAKMLRDKVGKRQCTGTVNVNNPDGTRVGKRCLNSPLIGQSVCYKHGGNASQARAVALRRLQQIIEPGLYLLMEIVMDDNREDSIRLQALKMSMDRVIPAGINIEAVMEHRLPGWQNVIEGMFKAQEPQAIESAEPSLSDLKGAYERCGYADPDACRSHAARVLGYRVKSAHNLSSEEIRRLVNDLRPYSTDGEVIDAEVLPEARHNRYEPTPGTNAIQYRSHSEDGYARMPGSGQRGNRARVYR